MLISAQSDRPERAVRPPLATRQHDQVHSIVAPELSGLELELSGSQLSFLAELGAPVGVLGPEYRSSLAELLGRLENIPKEPASAADAEGLHKTTLTVRAQDAELVIEKLVDLRAGTLVTTSYFSRGGEAFAPWQSAPKTLSLKPIHVGGDEEPATAQQPDSEEGVKAFLRGAIYGDFGESNSYSAMLGQTVVGFIPPFAIIADVRDLGAALKRAHDGEPAALLDVAIATVGFIPGMDWMKSARRAARKKKVPVQEVLSRDVEGKIDDLISEYRKNVGKIPKGVRRNNYKGNMGEKIMAAILEARGFEVLEQVKVTLKNGREVRIDHVAIKGDDLRLLEVKTGDAYPRSTGQKGLYIEGVQVEKFHGKAEKLNDRLEDIRRSYVPLEWLD